ncbi:DegT/DnrJ/EryC1/StrS family aminotransferase [Paenibacillus hemerocallicola]|uniref:DegT/DnrJ/EryC1/StrS family aminotransferase n=1 Tax=Paenibacillus hemerocallicola TaxID=1172614 RepID=A0A5C4TEN1_9BACL|nr:DegT/DnrJ/EryC1/StrS family aminotransferase [Paenibacillus hemerocallicola]TNJ66950.1 DegT/DnrJ/EryC1/StrS family aminotransferase [Paenibacillus hemerocallicola]
MQSETEHKPVRTKPWKFGMLSTEEFGEAEKELVLGVLEKKRVFRFLGSDKEQSEAYRLERLYRGRTGAKHALAVNSGTSALVSALIGAGVGPGDEVIVPAYTYIATAAAVLIARAVPVIVEADDSLTMDPQSFEAAITPYTKAVIPVHMRGVPCRMDEIMEIAGRRGILVIEDVAQANGGSYKGRPLGSFGRAGCFSFQQYKLVTAGEGGLVVTNDDTLYARANIYHDSAFVYWDMNADNVQPPFAGENYRLSEINAALALAQSGRIDTIVSKLRRIKATITAAILDLPQIRLQAIPDPQGDVSYSLVFYLPTADEAMQFSHLLSREGIPNGTIGNNGFADRHIYKNWTYVMEKRGASERDTPWNCASYKGNVQYSPEMCPITLDWLGRAITIGLHQHMSEEDCDDVIRAIRKTAASL